MPKIECLFMSHQYLISIETKPNFTYEHYNSESNPKLIFLVLFKIITASNPCRLDEDSSNACNNKFKEFLRM